MEQSEMATVQTVVMNQVKAASMPLTTLEIFRALRGNPRTSKASRYEVMSAIGTLIERWQVKIRARTNG